MTSPSMQLWKQLASEEPEAARIGRGHWKAFVRKCERELGEPWALIRETFDGLHKSGLTNHPAYREPRR